MTNSNWFTGKKTYIIAFLGVVDVIFHALTNSYPSNAEVLLAAAGLAVAIRHSIEKLE